MYRDLYGREIGEDILGLLRVYGLDTIDKAKVAAPIYLHAFDYGTVKYWGEHTELPNNFLCTTGNAFNLTDVAIYATGIGFNDFLLWDYAEKKPSSVFIQARELGLLVHMWTFKDDVVFMDAK